MYRLGLGGVLGIVTVARGKLGSSTSMDARASPKALRWSNPGMITGGMWARADIVCWAITCSVNRSHMISIFRLTGWFCLALSYVGFTYTSSIVYVYQHTDALRNIPSLSCRGERSLRHVCSLSLSLWRVRRHHHILKHAFDSRWLPLVESHLRLALSAILRGPCTSSSLAVLHGGS